MGPVFSPVVLLFSPVVLPVRLLFCCLAGNFSIKVCQLKHCEVNLQTLPLLKCYRQHQAGDTGKTYRENTALQVYASVSIVRDMQVPPFFIFLVLLNNLLKFF